MELADQGIRGMEAFFGSAEAVVAPPNNVQLGHGTQIAYFPTAGAFLPVRIQSAGATSAPAHMADMRRLVHEADLREYLSFVEQFRSRVSDLDIWARYEPELRITVVLPERDLPRELEVSAVFLDLSQELTEPDRAELRFRLADEPTIEGMDGLGILVS